MDVLHCIRILTSLHFRLNLKAVVEEILAPVEGIVH